MSPHSASSADPAAMASDAAPVAAPEDALDGGKGDDGDAAEPPEFGLDEGTSAAIPAERGLISRLLPPAIRLWLHTQMDHLEGLEFRLEGKDRQILSGHIPQVSLSAQQAVYRGLHVSQAAVAAREIRINLGQILRGKPLRLLQAFPVEGRVYLCAEEVRASLHAPLLEQGLQDVFQRWAEASPQATDDDHALRHLTALPPATQITDITLGDGTLTLTWGIEAKDVPAEQHLRLHTHLTMQEGRYLTLGQTEVQVSQSGHWADPTSLADVVLDLGSEAQIHHLAVTPQAIEMAGTVRVIP